MKTLIINVQYDKTRGWASRNKNKTRKLGGVLFKRSDGCFAEYSWKGILICDNLRRIREGGLLSARNVIDMIAQSDEKVEEELGATVEHLQLHRPASLECAAAADDESEVMRS